MSRFDEVFGKDREPAPGVKGKPFYGSFRCQSCDLDVEEAEWFVGEGILIWTCEQKHRSFMENFRLG